MLGLKLSVTILKIWKVNNRFILFVQGNIQWVKCTVMNYCKVKLSLGGEPKQ